MAEKKEVKPASPKASAASGAKKVATAAKPAAAKPAATKTAPATKAPAKPATATKSAPVKSSSASLNKSVDTKAASAKTATVSKPAVAKATVAKKPQPVKKVEPKKEDKSLLAVHKLRPAFGARHSEKRLGRGIGSGLGKTSGKGHKGQNARSGGGVRLGFEGGQIPLIRRLPKRGFTNNFRKIYTVVNVEKLNDIKEKEITLELLLKLKIVNKKEAYGLKILGDGEVTRAYTVKCAKITESAAEKIKKAGGKVELI